jgi:hypothetical protein
MPRPLLLTFNSSVPELEKLVCDARHIRSLVAVNKVSTTPIAMSALPPKADMRQRQGCSSVVQSCPLLPCGHSSDGERTLLSIYA